MRRLFLLIVISIIAISNMSLAAPVIDNVSLLPSSLWLGEDMTLHLRCTDDPNNTITQVYTNILGPSLILPTLRFSGFQDYSLVVDRMYFDRTGNYDANMYCTNDKSETSSSYTSFTVSKLTGYVNSVSPSPAYTGDIIEVDFMVLKNGVPVTSDVIFNISLDNQLKQLRVMPAYDTNKGWVLRLDSPAAGLYSMKVTAFYDRTSVYNYSSLDVRNNIEFSIENLDKSWIRSNDNATATIRALDRGSTITMNSANTGIRIGSVSATITSISQRGNLFDVRFIAPSLSSGSYNIEAMVGYNGQSYSATKPINYIVPVSGQIVDANNKVITSQIDFLTAGSSVLTVSTDSYGQYSGVIPPGTYDIRFTFPKSTLYLHSSTISSFDDPAKFFYSEDPNIIPGIRNAGLYDFEMTMPYSSADAEMTYTEKNVIDENRLKLFRCSDWNSGRTRCNSEWLEVSGDFDTVRNKAKLTTTSLGAFVVGEIKSIISDYSLDKGSYSLNDEIKIRGIVKDEDKNIVENASVEAYVNGMLTVFRTTTDSNGIFALTMPTPSEEGSYAVSLKIRKQPYIDFSSSKTLTVSRSRSLFLEFPDSVNVERGSNITQTFSLTNNGQADINDLKLRLDGIGKDYYTMADSASLRSGEKKELQVTFSVPVYAQTGITSVTIVAEASNVSQEKIFGLNIQDVQQGQVNVSSPPTGMASSFSLPFVSYTELAYLSIFTIASFSAAILLKKVKLVRSDRSKIKDSLVGIKNELESRKEIQRPEKVDRYDKVIATEFPNFMSFTKNLVKDDNNGKDY
jgi:hypothetical protein